MKKIRSFISILLALAMLFSASPAVFAGVLTGGLGAVPAGAGGPYSLPAGSYTVTFDANGGKYAPYSQTKTSGIPLTLPSSFPTRLGYTFLGWAANPGAAAPSYLPGGYYTTDASITLYAVWKEASTITPGTYTAPITFEGQWYYVRFAPAISGTYTIYSASNYDTFVYLYDSTGLDIAWNDDDGSGYNFKLSYFFTGGEVYYFRIMFRGSRTGEIPFTLEREICTVTYDANGGSGAPKPQTKTPGEPLTLYTAIPTRLGYSFLGWAESKTAKVADYLPGASYTSEQSVTLYAAWERANTIAPGTYSAPIAYDGQRYYYRFAPSVSGTYTIYSFTFYNAIVYLYDSAGNQLAYDDNSGEIWNFKLTYSFTAGEEYYFAVGYPFLSATGDLLFTLTQGTGNFTVAYDANGGFGAPNPQTKDPGETLTLSRTKPSRFGYNFLGWSADSTSTTAAYLPGGSYTLDASNVLYAVWEEASAITSGSYTAPVTYGDQRHFYRFEPADDGDYTIYSTSNKDTAVYLYDSTGKMLADDDDSGRDYNFFLSYSFTGGEVYYFLVRFDTSSLTGDLPFTLTSNDNIVFFDANGGHNAPKPQPKTPGEPLTLSTAVPTRFGYNFLGWSADSAAAEAAYLPGASYTGNGLTLYAVWKQTAITPGAYTAPITYANQWYYYRFEPAASGTYIIFSTSEYDPQLYLYDSTGQELAKNDEGGENHNFYLQYSFTAGEVYYFAIQFYFGRTGEIPFMLGSIENQVSYDANGGSGAPSPQLITPGEPFTLSAMLPTRLGYNFLGWAESKTATAAKYLPGASYTGNGNVTLYAVWEQVAAITPGVYTAPITYGGQTCFYRFEPADSGTYTIFSSASYQDTRAILYDSTGKQLNSNDDGGSGVNFLLSYSFTAGEVYYFEVEFVSRTQTGELPFTLTPGRGIYTVTYHTNGGKDQPSDQTKPGGGTLILSSVIPTRRDYNFLGWSESKTATAPAYLPGGSYTADASVTLYAVWEQAALITPGTYTAPITYDGQEYMYRFEPSLSGTYTIYSTSGNDSYVYLYDSEIRQLAVNDDGGQSWDFRLSYSFTAGEKYYYVVKFNNNRTGELPFALEREKSTVSYDANGGSNAPNTQTKTLGEPLTLSMAIPTRFGYNFLGWSESKTAEAATYQPGASYTSEESVTLYAVWEQAATITPGAYTAPIVYGGQQYYYRFVPAEDGMYTVYSSSGNDTKVTLYAPSGSQLGYDDNGGSGDNFRLLYSFTAGSVYFFAVSFTGNTSTGTIPFTLERELYAVSYDANGGSDAPKPQTKTPGEALTLSTGIPSRLGYTFLGWSESKTAASAAYLPGGSYTADASITLYAVWEQAAAITPGSYTATIAFGGQNYYYRFVPSVSGVYTVNSASDDLTIVALFDSEGRMLATNYVDGNNVLLPYSFTADAEYYISVTFFYSRTGEIPFTLEREIRTVSYNANGGSDAPASQTKTPGEPLTLSTVILKRLGYTFLGWSAGSTASAAAYLPGGSYTAEESVTLYAVWEQAATITPGSYTAPIAYGGQQYYYRFAPSASGTYIISSSADAETRVFLYDSTGTELASDDGSAENRNFRLSYSFTGGAEYYVGVMFLSSTGVGEIPFTLEGETGNSLGDVDGNGKITAGDARYALRAAVGLENYPAGSREFLAADVDLNERITAADARLILRRAVGYIDPEWGKKKS